MCAIKSKAEIEDCWWTSLSEVSPELRELTVRRLRLLQIAGARHGKAGIYPDGEFASDADWCYGPGAEIRQLEELLEDDSGAVHDLYADAHSALFRDGSINPADREEQLYAFYFGCAGHEVRVHARSIDEGAEQAAQYAYGRWPGLFFSDQEWAERFNCALTECGWPFLAELFDPAACDPHLCAQAWTKANADVTYFDPGIYIASHEWNGHEVD